jgi:hypothetical protein
MVPQQIALILNTGGLVVGNRYSSKQILASVRFDVDSLHLSYQAHDILVVDAVTAAVAVPRYSMSKDQNEMTGRVPPLETIFISTPSPRLTEAVPLPVIVLKLVDRNNHL